MPTRPPPPSTPRTPWIFTQEAPEEGPGASVSAPGSGARGGLRVVPHPKGGALPGLWVIRGREGGRRASAEEATRLNLCAGRAGAFGKGGLWEKEGGAPPHRKGQEIFRGGRI